jgi:hypothetical protein
VELFEGAEDERAAEGGGVNCCEQCGFSVRSALAFLLGRRSASEGVTYSWTVEGQIV